MSKKVNAGVKSDKIKVTKKVAKKIKVEKKATKTRAPAKRVKQSVPSNVNSADLSQHGRFGNKNTKWLGNHRSQWLGKANKEN